MIARAAIIAALLPAAALAAPILTTAVQWTPGISPCDGACSLPWALDNMVREGTIPQPVAQRILAGEAEMVEGIARPGDIFIGMSYAVGGEARWDERIYQLADGDRHHVTDELHVEFGGYTYRIANIRTCSNWAPRPPVPIKAKPTPAWAAPVSRPTIQTASLTGFGAGTSGIWAGDNTVTVRTPDTPSPIPLPGSVWSLLTGALGLLGLWGLRGQE